MPDQVLEFDTLSTLPTDSGEPSISASDIAREAVAAAVRPSASAPGSQFDEITPVQAEPLPSDESQHMEPGAVREPELPADEVKPEVEPLPVETPPVEWPADAIFSQEDYKSLQESGVDIPLAPNEVPNEFQEAYGTLAQALIDTHQSAQERVLDAQNALMQVKDFADSLQTSDGQERLLLGLAMNSPETFAKAMETVTKMQEDSEFATQVRHRLETDIKYEAAERKERAMSVAEAEVKGRQVESRTVRLAKRLGVDKELAKDFVASRILQNEQAANGRAIT